MKYFILFLLIVITIIDLCRNTKIKKYHVYGQENMDTILFIHGLTDDYKTWNKNIPILSKYYRCVVVDRTSDKKYLNFEQIYSIIKKTKGNGKLYCICASFGCEAAYKIQRKYNCFYKMLFCNFTWNPKYTYDLDNSNGFIYKLFYNTGLAYQYMSSVFKTYNFYFLYVIGILLSIPWVLTAMLFEYIDTGYIIYIDVWIAIKKLLSFNRVQRQAQANAYKTYTDEIFYEKKNEKIKPVIANIPVLCLVGEHDNIGHVHKKNIDILSNHQNVDLEIVEGHGHWFFQTVPDYFNERVLSFLN